MGCHGVVACLLACLLAVHAGYPPLPPHKPPHPPHPFNPPIPFATAIRCAAARLRKPWLSLTCARTCSPPQRRGRAADPRHACGRARHHDVQHQLADGHRPAGAVQRRQPRSVLLRPGLGQQRALVGGLPRRLHVLLGTSQLQRCVTPGSWSRYWTAPRTWSLETPCLTRLPRCADRYATHDYWSASLAADVASLTSSC